MLDHIVQKKRNDCVIAAAAWAANADYEAAAELSPVKPGTRGLYPLETCKLLRLLTGTGWRVSPKWFRKVRRFAPRGQICLVYVRKPWQWRIRHCIGMTDQWVYDPAFPHAFRPSEYPRKDWRIVRVFRATSPDLLSEARRENLWKKLRAGLQGKSSMTSTI